MQLIFAFVVPCTNWFILGVTDQGIWLAVKKDARYVVLMTSDGWVLPCYLIRVLPKLDLFVVRAWCYDVLWGMEAHPIAASLMSVKHFDTFYFDSNEWSQVFSFSQFFPQHWEVPDPDSRIQRSRHDQIFLWMELCTHNIVTMSRDDVDTSSTLVIPNAHGLIITGR